MDQKLILLIFVFLLIFSAFTGSLFLARQTREIKAQNKVPVSGKSLCLPSTLSAKLGDTVPITCVSRDQESNSISGSQCCFVVASGVGTVSPTCLTTDGSGMAKASLSSTSAGVVQVNCQINGSISAGSTLISFAQ